MYGNRSIYRPQDKSIPTVQAHWADEPGKNYTLQSWYLEEYALFKTFNEPYFTEHILPDSAIPYRYNTKKTVPGTEIKKLVDNLVQEVLKKNRVFTDFDVLCKKDFNRRACSGLMILKCKHHPFVLKLFMENPKSFVKYSSKGIVPLLFFFLSGGLNRHLVGFTRVRNLHILKDIVAQSPEWADRITFPRKWFILPQQSRWIEIEGTNIGQQQHQLITIPGIYGIIADWVDAEREASMFNKDDKKTCMSLCNHLGLAIDPHVNNFLYEKGTGKIAIIDTEHFLSLVGLKDPIKFTGYFSWVWHLGNYWVHRMFLQDKQARRTAQFRPNNAALLYDTGGITSPCTQLASHNKKELNGTHTKPS